MLLNKLYKNKLLKLHEPFFNGNEKKYINECIETNYVSTVGQFVVKFQEKLKKFYKLKVYNTCNQWHVGITYSIKGM